MNFFEHQAQARRQSRWLILAFVLATIAIVVAVDLVVLFVLAAKSTDAGNIASPGVAFADIFTPQFLAANGSLLAGSSAGVVGLISLSSLFKAASLRGGGGKVARDLGGTLVDADTRDPLRRRLRNVVEEIALASGVPVPEIYVLEQEAGINAFAAGYSTSDAAIAVTSGTLEKLSRSELQGVIAHEFSHIFNGDMRINIRLMGVLFGIMVLALIGRKLIRSLRYSSRSSRDGGMGAIILIGLAVTIIGYLGLFFARWIKAALSRQREYLADASAVQFTRDPTGIAGALKKIGAYSHSSYLSAESEEISHMLFGQGSRAVILATHPPLEKRISRIDPHFRADDITDLAVKLAAQERREYEAAAREKQAQETKKSARDTNIGGDLFNPSELIENIGSPQMDAIVSAAILASEIPQELHGAAHSTQWAPEVMFYALLDEDSAIRDRQLMIIATRMGKNSEQQLRHLIASSPPLTPEQRMPLFELSFPALKRRPIQNIEHILATIDQLILADGRVEVFEYLLSKLIRMHLEESLRPAATRSSGTMRLSKARSEIILILSMLAQHGHQDQAMAQAAFEKGMARLGITGGEMARLPEKWHVMLDHVLPKLDLLAAKDKQTLITALAEVVFADQRIVVAERELLRIICASLHAPLPMVLRKLVEQT